MRVLITGSQGFIGRSVNHGLRRTYRVVNVVGGVSMMVRDLAEELRTLLSSEKEIRSN